jgi:hypothetical protein
MEAITEFKPAKSSVVNEVYKGYAIDVISFLGELYYKIITIKDGKFKVIRRIGYWPSDKADKSLMSAKDYIDNFQLKKDGRQ